MAADLKTRPATGNQFSSDQAQLRQIAADVLKYAREQGASDCEVEVSEGFGQTVTVRRGEVETIEYNRDKGIGVTVYIGKLMREVDPASIRAKLDQWHSAARAATSQQQLAERWRARLLDEENALTLFASEYPHSDLQRLRALIAGIRRDQIADRPLRNYRELFRVVREIVASRREGVKTLRSEEVKE